MLRHIAFHQLNNNLSNMPEHITAEKPAVIQASTRVMNRAKLDVPMRLPLLHQNSLHTLKGTIGETNLQMLNPILVPTSSVELEAGRCAAANSGLS